MVQSGSALDLYRAPKDILAARTFSDLNEVPARIENGMARTVLGDFPAQGAGEGREAIACVRHSGVRLRPAGDGIPARVIDHRFLGDVALVEVAVQGLEEPLFARVRGTHAPPVGSEIGVRVDAGARWCSRPVTITARTARHSAFARIARSLASARALLPLCSDWGAKP